VEFLIISGHFIFKEAAKGPRQEKRPMKPFHRLKRMDFPSVEKTDEKRFQKIISMMSHKKDPRS